MIARNESRGSMSGGSRAAPRWGKAGELAAVALALALFTALLYARLLFTNRVLASGDILHYFYPYRDFAAAALRAGEIPFWNPYIFLGAPFLANPQAAALYPLHWPLSWLPVTKQIYWSAALHTWLLGLGGYLLLRRWGAGAWAGLAAGLALAGSGFYGGLIGHINQMNGAAWLPWAVLALDVHGGAGHLLRRPELWRRGALFGLLVALMFLAGHTQTLYINLFGLGVWAIWPAAAAPRGAGLRARLGEAAPRLLVYALGAALGLLISGAQLLPALELSNLGLRSGGLNYGEVSSFSLRPLKLPWTMLPTYGLIDLGVVFGTLGYTEYVAYVGLAGLALAALGVWRGRGTARTFGLLMAGLGLFLALGRWNPFYYLLYLVAPGFDLFRAPARWMMLYTLGMAVLAGAGADALLQGLSRRRRQVYVALAAAGLTLVLSADLLLAALSLPHTHPTAPQAVYDVRTAPAHLLTDPARTAAGPGAAGRFLSMSAITFDPGDMGDYRRILVESSPPQLDEAAFAELVTALKAQEILAPNLALLWRTPSVDGFDGGVLPLRRYLDVLGLFIPPDELVPDGRLREQVQTVPDARLLGLLNVQYVITDKVRDLWFEDVYYDRQIGVRLGPSGLMEAEAAVPYPFEATHVDLIGYAEGDMQALAQGNRTVATVTAQAGDVDLMQWPLVAGGAPGAALADGSLDSVLAASAGATVAYRDVEGGRQEYRVRLAFEAPATPERLVLRWVDGPVEAAIQAATLVDARTGMFLALLPSDRGRFRLAHSGDVKVYENLDVLPRAYLVHDVRVAADGAEALAYLSAPDFAPGETAVIEGGPALAAPQQGRDQVEIVAYGNQEVSVRIASGADGLLVLSDVNYPGWQAFIDGEAALIYATNYLFRGVYTPAGEHVVTFRYVPLRWRLAWSMSLAGLALTALLLAGTQSVRLRVARGV